MSSRQDSAARVRSRRSIAHVPRSKMTSNLDKENATADVGATQPFANSAKPAGKDKKSRSKSLGPGGLDALQNSNGNRRKVCLSSETLEPPRARGLNSMFLTTRSRRLRSLSNRSSSRLFQSLLSETSRLSRNRAGAAHLVIRLNVPIMRTKMKATRVF